MTIDSSHHAVITGANTGIGYRTALELARAGARVTIAGRSRDKSLAAIARIEAATGNPRLDYVPLDLGDLDDVRRCADDLASRRRGSEQAVTAPVTCGHTSASSPA